MYPSTPSFIKSEYTLVLNFEIIFSGVSFNIDTNVSLLIDPPLTNTSEANSLPLPCFLILSKVLIFVASIIAFTSLSVNL